jgi:SAM-dependent methyltransferase
LGKNAKKKLKVLDLGCGGGNVDGFLKSKFPNWEITGVDISTKALKIAKANYPKVIFLKRSVENLDFDSKSFDLILSLDTLEHFDNPGKVVKSARSVLEDDGVFFLAIPLEKQFPTLYWLMNKFGWDKGKRASVGHINVFNNVEILNLFIEAGFIETYHSFGGHLIYTILDYVCFWILRSGKKQKPSFESGLIVMKDGIIKTIILGLKNLASNIIYFESKIFSAFPGGRGHYLFRKYDQG